MMSLSAINELSNEMARRAARQRLIPYTFADKAEIIRAFQIGRVCIPNIGSYRPKGWELVKEHFCDKSGFGRDDEPAMSFDQFKELLLSKQNVVGQPTPGWAIIEEGEFQVYVGEFQKKSPQRVTPA